jgi:SAM-dependent methyltransferase
MSAALSGRKASDPTPSQLLNEHRRIWETKPVVRAVYEDCYRRIVANCRSGRTLEIGGGTGNLKSYLSAIVSLDIQPSPWLDLVADAHRLPFAASSFDNVVMFDVLHHLQRPRLFLQEASRILKPEGRIVVCEPAITPLSYFFYRYLHPEPVRFSEDPLAEGELSFDRDPWDSNQYLPTALFGPHRRRLAELIPGLSVLSCHYMSLLAYPLSGGFRRWSLLPTKWVLPLLKVEDILAPALGRVIGFRLVGVIGKAG